ncbi:MAG: XdhC family protein [Desulforhopalus sp.]|nr:XdhC family protein [Desulforhopalus sp.]
MRNILNPLLDTLRRGESAIFGTIVEQSGSAPRGSGAKMLVTADGTLYGTIGGGPVEGNSQHRAATMFQENSDFLLQPYNLDNETAANAGMVCGGAVKVLLRRLTPEHLPLFEEIQAAYVSRRRPVLVISLPAGGIPQLTLLSNGTFIGAELDEDTAAEVLHKTQKCRTPYTLGAASGIFYVEPQIDTGTLWLVGAGHISLATAKAADFVDFTVRVMDDRAEFANRERFPEAEDVQVLKDFSSCFPVLGPDDYVVIVTRGHSHDREVLEQALANSPGYLGMIGSRKKRDTTYRLLRDKGVTEEQLAAVHCPIGLSIGADTPEEIAICIVGELIRHRAGLEG